MNYVAENLFRYRVFPSPETAVAWALDDLKRGLPNVTPTFVDFWSTAVPVDEKSLIRDLLEKGTAQVQVIWQKSGKPVIGNRILIESESVRNNRLASTLRSLTEYLKGTPFEPA